MAVPANTRQTYGAIGIREDLSNIIYNISPMDTPFLNGCGRGTADNTLFEWQTDELQASGYEYTGRRLGLCFNRRIRAKTLDKLHPDIRNASPEFWNC